MVIGEGPVKFPQIPAKYPGIFQGISVGAQRRKLHGIFRRAAPENMLGYFPGAQRRKIFRVFIRRAATGIFVRCFPGAQRRKFFRVFFWRAAP